FRRDKPVPSDERYFRHPSHGGSLLPSSTRSPGHGAPANPWPTARSDRTQTSLRSVSFRDFPSLGSSLFPGGPILGRRVESWAPHYTSVSNRDHHTLSVLWNLS